MRTKTFVPYGKVREGMGRYGNSIDKEKPLLKVLKTRVLVIYM